MRAAEAGALRVRSLAREAGIPVIEDAPLARLLYATGAASRTIAPQTYVAVAQIVADLARRGCFREDRLRNRVLGRGAVHRRDPDLPLPPALLDALLALNVFGSALVLLLSLRVEEPLQFSAFGTLAAALDAVPALARSERDALDFDPRPRTWRRRCADPGFRRLRRGGNIVVGLIVFAILITIQFVVIASGAQRG